MGVMPEDHRSPRVCSALGCHPKANSINHWNLFCHSSEVRGLKSDASGVLVPSQVLRGMLQPFTQLASAYGW